MKARNDEHAKNEGLKESESLRAAHDRRAKLRTAAAELGALRRRIERSPDGYLTPREVSGTLADLAEVLDVLVQEQLASGAAR